jgi:integrase
MILITGQRPGEVAGMRADELRNLGSSEAQWELPSERTKNGRRHIVPLSSLGRQTIAEALEIQCSSDRHFVFVSSKRPSRPVERHSLSRALARWTTSENSSSLRERAKPHDLRRTVATRLAELGVPREDRKAILNHVEGDVHARHYDRYERLKERRAALEAWARCLLDVVADDDARVVAFPPRGKIRDAG